MTNSANTLLPKASLPRRLAAMGYDSLLLFAVLFLATSAYKVASELLSSSSTATVSTGQTVNDIPVIASGPWFSLYLISVAALFFAWFWQKNGQTLGMQVWRLRIQNSDGTNIRLTQGLIRFITAVISLSCAGIGYLWMLVDKQSLTWHDRISTSEVVVLPKKIKK
ncbi:MAG: RDD family protein [Pseudomonadales bacterium]